MIIRLSIAQITSYIDIDFLTPDNLNVEIRNSG